MVHANVRGAGPVKYLQGVVTIDDHPLIYLNVPKAACTTIKNQLYYMQFGKYSDAPLDIHASTELLRSRGGTEKVHAAIRGHMNRGHLVFSFVRDPGRRAYSCFVEKILYQKHRSFPLIRDHLASRYGLDLPSEPEEVERLGVDRVADGFLRYLKFVNDTVHDRSEIKKDAHWMPQSYILRRYFQQFIPDFIGRVETFDRDFSYVLGHYRGVHRPDLSEKFNEGPKPPLGFESILNDPIRGVLAQVYEADYSLFGYQSVC